MARHFGRQCPANVPKAPKFLARAVAAIGLLIAPDQQTKGAVSMAKKNPLRKGQHAPVEESTKSMAEWKPGSQAEQAGQVANKGDFGVSESHASRGERDYVSRNTKLSDPGAAQPWSHENADGARVSGAGAHASGEGSGSGGDIDTDIVGVGTGGSGISSSGPDDRGGADETDGSSSQFASGKPATGRVPKHANEFKGSTYTGPDRSTTGDEQGSDAATDPADRDDDSFKGEISSGEAMGEDNDVTTVEGRDAGLA